MAGYRWRGQPFNPTPPPETRSNAYMPPISPCGTPAAYARHKRRKEPVDEPCRQANIDMCAKRRASQKEKAAA